MTNITPTTPASAASARSTTWMKLTLLVVLVAVGIVVFRYTSLSEYTRPERLKEFFDGIAGRWWAPLAYIAVYMGGCLIALPGLLLTVLGGLTFGTAKGTLYVIIGSNLGASLAFGLARLLGREFVEKHVKDPLDAIDRRLRDQGVLRVLQLRLIPIVPFNILNFACGLSGVRYAHFLIGSLIGMLPGTFVYVNSAAALAQLYFAGAGVQDQAARDAARHTALINLGFSLVLLVIVSLIPSLYRRMKR